MPPINGQKHRITIGGEIRMAEEHLQNCLVLLDHAILDFKEPMEREYIHQVRARLAAALMYCKNVTNNPGAMVKL
jgi:hypothetical protein